MKTIRETVRRFILATLATSIVGSVPAAYGETYTLDTCPVSGEKLGSMGDPVVKQYEGREVRFCCGGCIAKFEANQARYLGEIDEKTVAAQKPYYPLTTCVVSGEKLDGAMGPAVDYVHNNRLVRLCCKGCIEKLVAAPDDFLKKLDEAVLEKQKPGYALETCIVSGEKFGGDMGEPIEYVVGNRLIRLCCKGCVKDLNKDPLKYLSALDGDAKTASTKAPEGSGTKAHEGHSGQ